MKQRIGFVLIASLLVATAGCDALLGFVLPSTLVVSFVNQSPLFNVDVTLLHHDDDDVLEAILKQIGTEEEFTIGPGQMTTFLRDCDELQAIMIDDADLRIVGSVGPETDTDVLRMGEDFECGDTLVFTFTHSDAILDFDVSFEAH